jgi:hypothetical protein
LGGVRRGVAGQKDLSIPQKMDECLLRTIFPLAKRLLGGGLIERWYSSRRTPGAGSETCRCRLYMELEERNLRAVESAIAGLGNQYEVEDEEPTQETPNFNVLQRACEVAGTLLRSAMDHANRLSEDFLEQIFEELRPRRGWLPLN